MQSKKTLIDLKTRIYEFMISIGKKKKMSRLNVNIITDYSRSISAPAPNLARAVSR